MGILSKFKKGLQKGSALLQGAFDKVSRRQSISENDLFDIEEALYGSDFGPETTEAIVDEIKKSFREDKEFRGSDAREVARKVLSDALAGSEGRYTPSSNGDSEVICLIGVNGSGKTTTCAKLGHRYVQEGKKVTLAACDTFRAAATEQLKAWAQRLDLDITSGHHGADSAAVAFDAYASALAKNTDVLLIDTAGRLHVKDNLMDELTKLKRVLQKKSPQAPQHSWLVMDGSTGVNGLSQAKVFHEKFGLTGLVVTKLDGTSKGGALVSIYRELKLPIFYIGLGEQPDDLQPFSVDSYLESILPRQMESVLP